MIINVGQRTDIPAFYSRWFYNRVKEGYVYVRNPFYPKLVTKYVLDPKTVDILCFCTKNPAPMLDRLEEIKAFRQFWYVSITPYGKDIEANVPDKHAVIESFKALSRLNGNKATAWRYDPILINERYTISYHLRAFEAICKELEGYTRLCVFSFIQLYEKTKKNFPSAREVSKQEKETLIKAMAEIASKYGLSLLSCHEEDPVLEEYGVDTKGCFRKEILEEALGIKLDIPPSKSFAREGCKCLLSHDIGEYNSCLHECIYCYATYDAQVAKANAKRHDETSPILLGKLEKDDILKECKEGSWLSKQLSLF
jgi:hypothetical protein